MNRAHRMHLGYVGTLPLLPEVVLAPLYVSVYVGVKVDTGDDIRKGM